MIFGAKLVEQNVQYFGFVIPRDYFVRILKWFL